MTLLESAQSGRLVVFAGAGISMVPPTGLPSWRAVNQIVVNALVGRAASLIGGDQAAEATKLILSRHEHEKIPPEYQAQILADVLGAHYFEVLRHLDSDRPNAVHLAIACLAGLGRVRAVITTNFDRTLEAAFRAMNVQLKCHFAPEHFAALSADREIFERDDSVCQLLKIHGSVEDAATLIDTLAQRKRGFPLPVIECIRDLLHFGRWLFLGFSGLDLEADPNYLSLAAQSCTARGFSWFVRQGTEAKTAVVRLTKLYGERAEIIHGELPAWLLDFASGLAPDAPSQIAGHLAPAPKSSADPLDPVRRGATEWAEKISPEISAIGLGQLVAACAEPKAAAAMYETVLSVIEQTERPGVEEDVIYLAGKAAAANSLGFILGQEGRHEEAVQWLQKAVTITGSLHPDFQDRCRRNLAVNLDALGDTAAARDLYESVLAGVQSRNDTRQTALALNDLSMHLIRQGDFQKAESLSKEALKLAITVGDEAQRITALNNLGIIAQRNEAYDTAISHYLECEEVCRRLGDESNLAAVIGSRADATALCGQFDEAEKLYTASLELSEHLGRRDLQAETFKSLGYISSRRGDHARAYTYFQQAAELYRAIQQPAGEAGVLFSTASLHLERGENAEAISVATEALSLATDRNPSLEAHALALIGRAALNLNQWAIAEQAFTRCRSIAMGLGDRGTAAFGAKHLGFTFLQQRNNASAFASFAEAAALYEALGDPANQHYCETGRTAASLNDRLEVLHAAGRASTEQAERQNVARQMTPLFPELIACLRELQAIQPAAECEFFAGSTFQLLGDFLQAVKHYRVAANDYGELNLNEQRREAHQRCEKLLALYTDHLLREGRLHDAIPHFLQLAEASGEIGNRAGFVHAALHAARALLQTTPNLEQARGMAQLAYENSDADSESARSALDIISQCEQRSVNLGKDKTSG